MAEREWWSRARPPRPEDRHRYRWDGDSLGLCVDRGWDDTETMMRLRLKDVSAVEYSSEHGAAVAIEVDYWCNFYGGFHRWPFEVRSFKTSGDQSKMTLNRYVVEVWDATRTRSLNAYMLGQLEAHPEWRGGIGA